MLTFWDGFEKEAKRRHSAMLERLRKGLAIRIKGQSIHTLGATRLGRILRKIK